MKHVITLRKKSDGSLFSGQSLRLHPGTDTTKYSNGAGNDDTTEAASLYTDNGDGTYYKTITKSGQYSVTVSGSAQDELTGIFIPGDDMIYETVLGDDFVKVAGVFKIADDRIGKNHINPGTGGTGQGLASDGLSQNSDGSVKALVDGSTIEIDGTTKALKVKSDVYAAASHNHDSTYPVKSVDGDDFEIDSNGTLKLYERSHLDGNYISTEKTLAKNLGILDAVITRFFQQSGEGSFLQLLHTLLNQDTTPSGSSPAATIITIGDSVGTNYLWRLTIPIYKLPEMKQLIFISDMICAEGTATYSKLVCDSLSIESAGIGIGNREIHGLYLNISSLANYQVHNIYIYYKAALAYAYHESLFVRETLTSLAGNTNYTQKNPTD